MKMVNRKAEAFVGIDLAFAKNKLLPICVCTISDGLLTPLELKSPRLKPPRGKGNAAAIETQEQRLFAREVLCWLGKVEEEFSLEVKVIAIDAPRSYGPRDSEIQMGECGISYISTPTQEEFRQKVLNARIWINNGNKMNQIPAANQLWMLVGFALYRILSKQYRCIETYPNAIIHSMGYDGEHKSTRNGFNNQVKLVANHLGLCTLEQDLNRSGYGSRHDKLDAYLSAWVASLPACGRRHYGSPQCAIWVPA